MLDWERYGLEQNCWDIFIVNVMGYEVIRSHELISTVWGSYRDYITVLTHPVVFPYDIPDRVEQSMLLNSLVHNLNM